MAMRHLHKGQGSVPSGGKGWHRAFQTGTGKTGERQGGAEAIVHPLFRKRRSRAVGSGAG